MIKYSIATLSIILFTAFPAFAASAETATPACVPFDANNQPTAQGTALVFCHATACTTVDSVTKQLATAKKSTPPLITTTGPAPATPASFGAKAQLAMKGLEASVIVSSNNKFAIIGNEIWNVAKDVSVAITFQNKMVIAQEPIAFVGDFVILRLTKSAGHDLGVYNVANKKVATFFGYVAPVKVSNELWLGATRNGVVRISSKSAKFVDLKAKSAADFAPVIVDGKAVYVEQTDATTVVHMLNAQGTKQTSSFSVATCK